jgi:hypothetical protein
MRRITGLATLAASFALSWSAAAADAGKRAKLLFRGDVLLRKRTQTQ